MRPLPEPLAVIGVVPEDLSWLESRSVIFSKTLERLDNKVGAHCVDREERSTPERRIPDAKDRADVAVAC